MSGGLANTSHSGNIEVSGSMGTIRKPLGNLDPVELATHIGGILQATKAASGGELARIAANAKAPVNARFSFHFSGERLKSIFS